MKWNICFEIYSCNYSVMNLVYPDYRKKVKLTPRQLFRKTGKEKQPICYVNSVFTWYCLWWYICCKSDKFYVRRQPDEKKTCNGGHRTIKKWASTDPKSIFEVINFILGHFLRDLSRNILDVSSPLTKLENKLNSLIKMRETEFH